MTYWGYSRRPERSKKAISFLPQDYTRLFIGRNSASCNIRTLLQSCAGLSAYWFHDPENLPGSGQGIEQVKSEIRSLIAEKHYIGHQLIDSQVRSFDIQSPTLAVVTTRETWLDTLYPLTENSPDFEEPVAQRGPYPLNATYTLEQVDLGAGPVWQVSGMVYAEQPPEFK